MAATDSTEGDPTSPREISSADRRQRPNHRREALLDAAEAVVRRVGPQVTTAQIAAEAGVTKPIIYRHFGDIHDLYQALAIRLERRLSAWLIEARKRHMHLTRQQRFHAVVGAFFRAVQREPKTYQFLVYTGGGEPDKGGGLSWFTRQWAGSVANYLSLLREETEVSAVSRATGVAMCGALVTAASWWLEDQTVPIEDVASSVADMLLDGMPADLMRPLDIQDDGTRPEGETG